MKKYPNQDECQALINLFNRPYISDSGCGDEFKKFIKKSNEQRSGYIKLWNKAFGKNSPWNVRVKFNRKGFTTRELYWDKEKAKQLGI